MTLFKRFNCAAILLAASALPMTANALPISGLSATGIDGIGVADSNYTLLGNGTAIGIVKHPAWITAPGSSNWIGISNGSVSDPQNTFFSYELSFDLTGLDASTASISGSWAVDNTADLFLNGSLVASNGTGFNLLASFDFNSGFLSGLNVLEFRTFNASGTAGNPTGLLVSSLSGSADELVASVPEPTVTLLLATGLIGMVGFARRKRS